MNKLYFLVTFFFFSHYWALNCKSFSHIQAANYVDYFPRLLNYNNEEIIRALNDFRNNQDRSGNGGHGVVKFFRVNHQQRGSVYLAIKSITKPWKRSKLVEMVDDEVDQWLKVAESRYVPNYYACIEGRYN